MQLKKFFISIIISAAMLHAQAQQVFPTYKVINGDTIYNVQLNEAVVVGKGIFKNELEQYKYNQMKFYIKLVLPYALEATRLFNDIETQSKTMTGSARRKYIKTRDKELKAQFSDKLKELNITQAKYLVKIINRNSGITCKNMLDQLYSPIKANSYSIWAKLNGINLGEKYNAEDNKDFESIMKSLGY